MTRERYHRIMHDVEQELLQMGEMVIADRVINICERIIFMVTGEILGN